MCVLVPDGTRACPLPMLMSALHQALHGRVRRLTVLVALGTHAPMSEPELAAHLGYDAGALASRYPGLTVANHAWWDDESLVSLGTLAADRVAELSGGLLREPVPVRVNRAVTEHDVTLIAGPVLPHEVAGFSGGNKYFFPGVSGREFIDASHWLGALITSADIIGTTGTTPVRAMIDEAAALVPGEHLALCLVTAPGGSGSRTGLHALSFGEPRAAWAAAARESARAHIRYLDAPVRRVLSVVPDRYPDLWTGAKGFYKVEPVVADGGQVVLYAPHIRQVAATHPEIERIGYHCRDYFLHDWERFRHLHWSDLAHSTHLRGAGSYRRGPRRARPGDGHAGHRHSRVRDQGGEPGLPRPGRDRPGALGGRSGHPGRAGRRGDAVPAPPRLVRGLVIADDLAGNAAALADLITVLAGPFPDLGAAPPGVRPRPPGARNRRCLARVIRESGQLLADFLAVRPA